MWKKRKSTVESLESNRTADIDCTRPKRRSAWRKAFGKWHKSHQHLSGRSAETPQSKALRVAQGPVYYRKDFRLHSSLSPREGNTSSSLEQDVILPSNWRLLSAINRLWWCLHWGLFLVLGAAWGLSLTFNTWAPLPTTQYNLYGFLVQKPFWTGQDRAVPSEYLSQQVCLSAEPELLKRWISNLLGCGCVQCGRACIAPRRDKTAWGPQGENPSLTASLQMSGTFSVMWLCDDHIVSLQTPKTREGTGEQKDNWEDTFYTLLWVLQ